MFRLRLAAAALNQTPLAWVANGLRIRAALQAAREAGAGVLCLPELCITGYGCEDMFFSTGVQQTALALLPELAAETNGLVACFGLPVVYEGGVYNAAAVACDGRLLGLVAKQHLAGDGIHYEPRWFRRWPAGEIGTLPIAGQSYPIGDLLFACGGLRIGLEICRDAWVADRTGARLADRGADVLLNPSASHFAFAKQQIRERFVLEGSRAFCVSYAYANLLGNEAGRSIYDGGTLLASGGRMLARGPRFSFADWLLTTTVVDVAATRRARAESFPDGDATATPHDPGLVVCDFHFPDVAEPLGGEHATASLRQGAGSREQGVGIADCGLRIADSTLQSEIRNPKSEIVSSPLRAPCRRPAVAGLPPGHPAWEAGPCQKEEEFARVVALGLFDYLRKSAAQGFVVSLSGGADSSAVAALVHLMAQLGGRELGIERFVERLPHLVGMSIEQSANVAAEAGDLGHDASFAHASRQIVGRLLTCVYQATRNSQPETLAAARAVAEAVGADFFHWNVDPLVDRYVETVSSAVGRPLDWQQDDLALQNIQARARAPGAWLIANLRGALLLTTSNRSEAAVGYATMDGDTCGGLAPIAGIDKAFLLDWLKWLEATGPQGVGPLPALSVVNRQRPTAELRPPLAQQTDEGDLMPYRVLDAIERAAIRDKLLPVEVFDAVRPLFPEHDAPQIGVWVERFFRLWCRNQWKRERYAPSFHLDDENLDPKTWCRFPILNSGFARELDELREHVRQSAG